ncbi:MAG: hypothetical protein ACYCV6_12040 [Steroidobacteraceae bacterium]
MSTHGHDPDTSGDTEVTDERPWHRRSRLYEREADIRSLVANGYSLRQIVQRLDLRVSRSALWRFLRRSTGGPTGEPAPAVPEAPLGAVEAEDAAVEALLAASNFTPPTGRSPR